MRLRSSLVMSTWAHFTILAHHRTGSGLWCFVMLSGGYHCFWKNGKLGIQRQEKVSEEPEKSHDLLSPCRQHKNTYYTHAMNAIYTTKTKNSKRDLWKTLYFSNSYYSDYFTYFFGFFGQGLDEEVGFFPRKVEGCCSVWAVATLCCVVLFVHTCIYWNIYWLTKVWLKTVTFNVCQSNVL